MSEVRGSAPLWPRIVCVVVALIAALAVYLTWYLFVSTATGQAVDRAAFESARAHQYQLWPLVAPLLDVISYTLVAIGAVTAVIIAFVRRRWTLALQALLVVAGANLTTQFVKSYLERPRILPGWTGPNSLPSGHVTVAASVSVAILLTAPRRWRTPVAVVGACWTFLIGLSTWIGQWHRPADVVAALLVVCAWGALVCAASGVGSLDTADSVDLGTDRGPPPVQVGGRWTRIIPVAAAVLGILALAATMVAFGALALGIRQAGALPEQSTVAYVGGFAAIFASVFGVFGILLWLRQLTLTPYRIAELRSARETHLSQAGVPSRPTGAQ
ncbi:MAG: phosphatase PAP2 family protein [Promicromonosporaceae bacterium]|nr:phosphatase PAP2 family protein [Promicromonosporaceae bacterium]